MAHDVFVSHSAKDKPTADAVCAVLEAQGIRCWVAPRDIVPGKDWGESIVDAIKGARVMVLVFSTHANDSHQIKREVERAVHKGIPVIPLRIEAIQPTASLEYFLSTPHWLDAFTPPLEKHLQYLAQIIRSIVEASLEEPASVPPMGTSKSEAAEAIKKEPAATSRQHTSPAPSLTGEMRKFPVLAVAIVALILACLGGWYFGVHKPEQMHQAALVRAERERLDAANKQAAEAKRQTERLDMLAKQKEAEELAARQIAEAKAKANDEDARQAEIKQKNAILAAKQIAEAKAKADAEAARQAEIKQKSALLAKQKEAELAAQQPAEVARQVASITTSNQTRLESIPRATATKISLADFNQIFGLKIGAKTDEVRGLFGSPDAEDLVGGFGNQELVWTYQAGGTQKLKIVFENQTKAVRSITVDENHLPWLVAKAVADPKLTLLGKPISDIEKLIGQPTWNSTSTFLYEDKGLGLSVDFFCPEYNSSKCFRIVINWFGQ